MAVQYSTRGALAFVGALLLSLTVAAHRINSVDTTIAWVEAAAGGAGRWQLTHQLHYHDAQTALVRISGDARQSVLEVAGQARLLAHLAGAFSVAADGTPVAFAPLGAEADGDYVYFYYESAEAPIPAALSITNSMLMALFEGQLNLVNVDAGGRVQTTAFIAGDKAKAVSLQ